MGGRREMEQINFGKTKEGQEVMNYFITNSKGMKVGVTDYLECMILVIEELLKWFFVYHFAYLV